MEHKPKRQTRERILKAALQLFNRFGEPTITTSAIAADAGMSHGNLYYHYPSKEKIVEDLFEQFCREIERTLVAPESRPANAEDVWLFLHLMFEAIFKYRFLYRDLNELLSRHRSIEKQFRRIVDRQMETAATLMQGLVDAGAMRASPAEIRMLAENMTLIATYWLSFAFVLDPRGEPDGETLTRGIVHILSLAGPYLGQGERALFERLSQKYLQMGEDRHGG
ncbi:MAG: TetR/AcrR family transcriptional regulator [Rhodomicrobium sp.]|jgi:AcrR family transcriptional regulator